MNHQTNPQPPEPLRSETRLYEVLRERICTALYPFGAILRETELAEEFGVSRTPVRETLQRLANHGLVETRRGVGTIVTAGGPSTLAAIYAMRIEVAGMIGRLATRPCPPESAAGMAALHEELSSLTVPCDAMTFWRCNERRHGIINALIENPELRQLHDLYYYKVAPFWFPYFQENPERELALLLRELEETAFWMATGDMVAVANMQQNHTSMGARRAESSTRPG
jgi:DNA-binding GntR family transcriptional regulator